MQKIREKLRALVGSSRWSAAVTQSRATKVKKLPGDGMKFSVRDLRTHVEHEVELELEYMDWSCDCDSDAEVCQHVLIAVTWDQDSAGQEIPGMAGRTETIKKIAYRIDTTENAWKIEPFTYVGDLKKPQNIHKLTSCKLGEIDSQTSIRPVDKRIFSSIAKNTPLSMNDEELRSLFMDLHESQALVHDGLQTSISRKSSIFREQLWVSKFKNDFVIELKINSKISGTFGGRIAHLHDGTWTILNGHSSNKNTTAQKYLSRMREIKILNLDQRDYEQFMTDVYPHLNDLVELQDSTQNELTENRIFVSAKPYRHLECALDHSGALQIKPFIAYGSPIVLLVDETLTAKQISRDTFIKRNKDEEVRIRDELAKDKFECTKLFYGENAVAVAQQINIQNISHSSPELIQQLASAKKIQGRLDFDTDFKAQLGLSCPESNFDFDPKKTSEIYRVIERSTGVIQWQGTCFYIKPEDLHKLRDFVHKILQTRPDDSKSTKNESSSIGLALIEAGQNNLNFVEALLKLENLDIKADADEVYQTLNAKLRPYQQQGTEWLLRRLKIGLGSMLCDDMGLGKTLQTLAVLKGKCLVVAPASLIYNWQVECQKFRPDICVYVYQGKDRKATLPQNFGRGQTHLVLCTYAVFRLDIEVLNQLMWEIVVLDEAQAIKNADSQTAQSAFRFQCKNRIALTGTPIENSLRDFRSIAEFVEPAMRNLELDPQVEIQLLRSLCKRRLKRDVAPELPEKISVDHRIDLSEMERTYYLAVLEAARTTLRDKQSNNLKILEAILRLRQICCYPKLYIQDAEEQSSKVSEILELIRKIKESGEKFILFSQWTSFLDVFASKIEGFPLLRLDGTTKDRRSVVERFQSASGTVGLLMTLKAGGVGLNLTEADHVIIADPWWNPATENQAIDRAHRIGRNSTVMVHRFYCADTIEQNILKMQLEKQEIADGFMDKDEEPAQFREIIHSLLEPTS